MTSVHLTQRLTDFRRERAALWRRHVTVAERVSQYDLNNAYQYVIAREEQHLAWLADAIRDLGGEMPEAPATAATVPVGDPHTTAIADDAQALEAFASCWRGRVATIGHARHRLMLDRVLGETLEHARLLRQASQGHLDLLGRRTGGERTAGQVLPTRWIE